MLFIRFSYAFHILFICFSYGFYILFICFLYTFYIIFICFSYGFYILFIYFSYAFHMLLICFLYTFYVLFICFLYAVYMLFICFFIAFHMLFIYFSNASLIWKTWETCSSFSETKLWIWMNTNLGTENSMTLCKVNTSSNDSNISSTFMETRRTSSYFFQLDDEEKFNIKANWIMFLNNSLLHTGPQASQYNYQSLLHSQWHKYKLYTAFRLGSRFYV